MGAVTLRGIKPKASSILWPKQNLKEADNTPQILKQLTLPPKVKYLGPFRITSFNEFNSPPINLAA